MSVEENKALVRRFCEEGWGNNNPEVFDEVCAADYTNSAASNPPDLCGPALPKRNLARNGASLSDYHWTIEEMIAEGDKVVVYLTWSGTHIGDWQGLPPTGKHIEWKGMQIYRIAEGRIAELLVVVVDATTVMWQLGVIPSWEEILEQARSKQA